MPPVSTLEDLYRTMYTIRYYNEALRAAFDEGAPIPAGIHGSLGQEAPAAGVCQHLRTDDWAFASHRSSHVAIAKGVDLEGLIAEQLGKRGGVCSGKGGEQHLFDETANVVSGAIVAQHLPTATGVAMAHRRRGTDRVAVGFVGDGAANQGAFYESLNFASVNDLPVVFVVEDNAYGISTPKSRVTAVADNAERARGQGMPGVRVEENDVTAVHEAAGEAVARARAGEGPTLLEVRTHRRTGHFFQDPEGYRGEGEYEAMAEDDCMPRIEADLRAAGVDDADVAAVRADVEATVDGAIEAALAQDDPDPEAARAHVFAGRDGGA
ncbi:MAG: thiamine pyrophosphate-dependent dehydrogenase E1 component subunit alpha [Halobacteriaceae archaeon]